jgi:hypothetical membrane protein
LVRPGVVTALLLCGTVALALYIAMDLTASLRYDGYSYTSQTISELSAVGAPTRHLWLAFVVPYELLVAAFAAGVLVVAGEHRRIQAIGGLLVLYAISGFAWPFAPMHQREVLAAGGDTFSDTMHLVLAGITSVLFFAMIGLGAWAFGKRFRLYSFATIAMALVFGGLTGLGAQGVQDNDSTPWLGVFERINVFGAMLWMAVFGLLLWRRERAESA